MKTTRPERALERILLAVERDVTDATDEEVLAAAGELGMNPEMKGTAALVGVTVAVWPRRFSRLSEAGGLTRPRTPRRRSKDDSPDST